MWHLGLPTSRDDRDQEPQLHECRRPVDAGCLDLRVSRRRGPVRGGHGRKDPPEDTQGGHEASARVHIVRGKSIRQLGENPPLSTLVAPERSRKD